MIDNIEVVYMQVDKVDDMVNMVNQHPCKLCTKSFEGQQYIFDPLRLFIAYSNNACVLCRVLAGNK